MIENVWQAYFFSEKYKCNFQHIVFFIDDSERKKKRNDPKVYTHVVYFHTNACESND